MINYNLTISQVISNSYTHTKKNLGTLMPILLLLIIPTALLTLIEDYLNSNYIDLDNIFFQFSYYRFLEYLDPISIIINITSTLLGILSTSVAIKLLYDNYTLGYSDFRDSFKFCVERFLRLILLSIMLLVLFLVVLFVAFILVTIVTILTIGFGGLALFPVIMAIILIFIPLSSLYISTMLINDCSPFEAIKLTNKLFYKTNIPKSIGYFLSIGGIVFAIFVLFSVLKFIPIAGELLFSTVTFFAMSFAYSANNIIVEQNLKTPIQHNILNDFHDYDNL